LFAGLANTKVRPYCCRIRKSAASYEGHQPVRAVPWAQYFAHWPLSLPTTSRESQAKADTKDARESQAKTENKLADAEVHPKGESKPAKALPKVNKVSARGCEGGSGTNRLTAKCPVGRRAAEPQPSCSRAVRRAYCGQRWRRCRSYCGLSLEFIIQPHYDILEIRSGAEDTTIDSGTGRQGLTTCSETHKIVFGKHRPVRREHPFGTAADGPAGTVVGEFANLPTIDIEKGYLRIGPRRAEGIGAGGM
jgi:hypothetical protein